ncbi:MAG: hypothetical protein ACRD4L_03705 [Pyrinomonadaceae bacterium]
MKRYLLFLLLAVLLIPSNIPGQQRKRKKSTSSAATLSRTAELDQGRRRAAEQIKTLTRFLYVYGRVTKDIESVSATSGQSGRGRETLENAKRQIDTSFQNVLAGMDSLETYFRTTPSLQLYYNQLAGGASRVETASQYAGSGKYDEAGRLLIEVVNSLVDVQAAIK